MILDDEELLTLDEAAEAMGMTIKSVKKHLQRGNLTGWKVPNLQGANEWTFVSGASVERYMARQSPERPAGWLSPDETAAALGVSRNWIMHLVATGSLRCVRGYRVCWIDPATIAEYREYRASLAVVAKPHVRAVRQRIAPGRCPRCWIVSDGLCERCQSELAGVPYWAGRESLAQSSSNWGRLTAGWR